MLAHLNRRCGADFALAQFAHRAFYNARAGRIEMHLDSLRDQTVHLGGAKISFRAGENILTKVSYKYTLAEFGALAARAGDPRRHLLPRRDTGYSLCASCRQMIGNVWEWTADTFDAFPGFELQPYAEYSAPSFGQQKVLRGGGWATRARVIRNTYRNFYTPDRNNIFAGFRTCAR